MSEYRVEIYETTQLDRIARLRRLVFGGTPAFNQAYLAWKYHENPYLPEPLIYVALLGDEVAGMRCFYGTSWLIPGLDRPQTLPSAADLGIAPDHRDRGLFDLLTEFAVADLRSRGFRYVINMSATPANYVTSMMMMGWESLGSYEPLIWSTAIRVAAGSVLSRSSSALGVDRFVGRLRKSEDLRRAVRQARFLRQKLKALRASEFQDLDSHRGADDTKLRIELVPRASLMSKIVAQSADKTRIRHTRDEEYFRWRYRNPASSYRFLFPPGDDSDGYIALQRRDSRSTRLVDWGGDEDRCADLVSAFVQLAPPTQLSTWGATLPAPFRQHLSNAGFVPDRSEGRQGLLLRDLDPTKDESLIDLHRALDAAIWDLRMIFSDGY